MGEPEPNQLQKYIKANDQDKTNCDIMFNERQRRHRTVHLSGPSQEQPIKHQEAVTSRWIRPAGFNLCICCHVAACTSVTELEHDQTFTISVDAALEGISTVCIQCV